MNSYGNLFYMIYNAFSLPFENATIIVVKQVIIGLFAYY